MASIDPFQCPAPATLTTVPDNVCPESFDQIVRAIFIRKGATAPFSTSAGADSIATKAKLLTLLAATDSTKAVITPKFGGLTIPKTEPAIEGLNDNLYPDGAGIVVPGGPVELRAILSNKGLTTKQALQKLTAESDGLQVLLINRFGHVILQSTGFGFPLLSVRCSSVGSEGLNKPNQFDLIMMLPFGWDNDYAIVKPTDYDATTIKPA